MRQKYRFHGLKKIKIRQTWNKYNLYNLSRMKEQRTLVATFFQQKWSAKSISRAYHGEYIREKQWQKMFRPFAPAVVPLNAEELAESDGSEQAAGRGSGKDADPRKRAWKQQQIPYMGMVYGPMERRLDTAIFRALFASSARQARQFVVHGSVKVNGKKMIYPGYLLNPGDMFQVDPDKVMYATGVQKETVRKKTRVALALQKKRETEARRALAAAEAERAEWAKRKAEASSEAEAEVPIAKDEPTESAIKNAMKKKRKEAVLRVKTVLEKGKTTLSAKRKQDLRALLKQIATIFKDTHYAKIDAALEPLMSTLTEISPQKTPGNKYSKPSKSSSSEEVDKLSEELEDNEGGSNDNYRTAAEREEIKNILKALEEARENPVDLTKPYATPWKPRPWMAPFAFIPRYLEVNQNICAAVYLRHPVARPGLAEVPSPFPMETSQLAFNWYLRRR